MINLSLQHSGDRPDRVSVVIDNRFDVKLIRNEDGLRIEVYPLTDGEVWDDPFDRFEVQESEILVLEQEMSRD